MRDYVAEHSAGVKYGAFSVLFLNVTALGAALGLRGIHQVGCGEWVPECRLRSWKVKAAVMQPLFHNPDYDANICAQPNTHTLRTGGLRRVAGR